MFLLWEGVILSPSFLEHVKNSLHSNGSLPSNWVQDENIRFASNHIISGKINPSINHVSDILEKCLYSLKIKTEKNLTLIYRGIVSHKLSNSSIFFFRCKMPFLHYPLSWHVELCWMFVNCVQGWKQISLKAAVNIDHVLEHSFIDLSTNMGKYTSVI